MGFRDDFAEFLIAKRTELDVSQSDLARATGIQQSRISRWEAKNAEPYIDHVFQVERALGLARGSILEDLGYYTSNPRSVREALDADRALSASQRSIIIDLYNTQLRRTAQGQQDSIEIGPKTLAKVQAHGVGDGKFDAQSVAYVQALLEHLVENRGIDPLDDTRDGDKADL